MASAHQIAGIGKRGWIVIQVLEEEPQEEGIVVDDTYTVIKSVVGEIHINLDEITRDNLIETWYSVAPGEDVIDGLSVGENDGLGCIKVRMLMSSHPNLADKSNSWLLDDYSIPLILETANRMNTRNAAHEGKCSAGLSSVGMFY